MFSLAAAEKEGAQPVSCQRKQRVGWRVNPGAAVIVQKECGQKQDAKQNYKDQIDARTHAEKKPEYKTDCRQNDQQNQHAAARVSDDKRQQIERQRCDCQVRKALFEAGFR